jgi:hypothetical protein
MPKIQVRRGPATGTGSWALNDAVLDVGELGLDTTNKVLKVGDGSASFTALPYLKSGTITFSSDFTATANYNGTADVSLGINSTSNTIVANTAKALNTAVNINGASFTGAAPIAIGPVIYGKSVTNGVVNSSGSFTKLYASSLSNGAPTSPVAGDIWIAWS